jgi:hypothetical protein
MAKEIKFVALVLIALLTENIFALDNFWDWRFQPYFFRPQIDPLAMRALPTVEMVTESMVTVWISNNNSSQTEVKLTPTADGFLGPKGEFYSSMPTQEQLKPLYGVYSPPPVRNNVIFYLGKVDGIEKVVVLTKNGEEYIGPQGEKYFNLPTIEQLKLIYVNHAQTVTYLTDSQ